MRTVFYYHVFNATTVIIKSKCIMWYDDDNEEAIKKSIDGLELMHEWNWS